MKRRALIPCLRTGKGYLLPEGGRFRAVSEPDLSRPTLLLVSGMQTLSLRPFAFPFSNVTRIREALRLQVQPLRSGLGDVEILPLVVGGGGKGARGVAWILSRKDFVRLGERVDRNQSVTVWPVPLAFAADAGEDGAVVWADEENLCSLLFQEGIPVLYRWRPREGHTPDEEEEWLRKYCGAAGREIPRLIRFDAQEQPEEAAGALFAAAERTLAAFPSLAEFSVSSRGVDAALVTDRLLVLWRRALLAATLLGLLFAAGARLSLREGELYLDRLRTSAVTAYRSVFGDGPVNDPLSQARARLMQAQGTGKSVQLADLIALLGEAWEATEGKDILLETLRYGEDGAEIIGSAATVEAIQAFQRQCALLGAKNASARMEAQLGDISQAPGGGLRFTMTVRWSTS